MRLIRWGKKPAAEGQKSQQVEGGPGQIDLSRCRKVTHRVGPTPQAGRCYPGLRRNPGTTERVDAQDREHSGEPYSCQLGKDLSSDHKAHTCEQRSVS